VTTESRRSSESKGPTTTFEALTDDLVSDTVMVAEIPLNARPRNSGLVPIRTCVIRCEAGGNLCRQPSPSVQDLYLVRMLAV